MGAFSLFVSHRWLGAHFCQGAFDQALSKPSHGRAIAGSRFARIALIVRDLRALLIRGLGSRSRGQIQRKNPLYQLVGSHERRGANHNVGQREASGPHRSAEGGRGDTQDSRQRLDAHEHRPDSICLAQMLPHTSAFACLAFARQSGRIIHRDVGFAHHILSIDAKCAVNKEGGHHDNSFAIWREIQLEASSPSRVASCPSYRSSAFLIHATLHFAHSFNFSNARLLPGAKTNGPSTFSCGPNSCCLRP
ncbi:Uncharacterised protein [Burkholderia pseudomallei]|nr:Uncharacterised protein [Burkholderia pseudomallei]